MHTDINDWHYIVSAHNENELFSVEIVTRENKQNKTIVYEDVRSFGLYHGSCTVLFVSHGNNVDWYRGKYLVKWSLKFKGSNNESKN